jgi:ATP-dependent DNA helicase DinG
MADEELIPPHDRYLDALFGERGYLSRAFPSYRPRPGQIALAEAVDRAIVRRGHLLAEGPTGTGKSLAYAAPASYHASTLGRPVVIVTANIALQEQIVAEDLPLLRQVVPWDFTFALLKGRNNYLCVDKLSRYKNERATGQSRDASAEERRQLPIIEQWADDCVRGGIDRESGDVSELPFEPLRNVWRRFSVPSDECKRSRCRYFHECFAISASERARQAALIVTNYHMFYAHLTVYLETGKDLVISPFEVAILDEAHKAADIARDVFGFRISGETVRRLGRKIRELDSELGENLEAGATDFFFLMAGLARDRDRYKARLTGEYLPMERESWERLQENLTAAYVLWRDRAFALEQQYEALKADGYGLTKEAEELAHKLGDVEILRDRAVAVLANLLGAMEPKKHPRGVFFFEEDEKKRISISSKLIHPSDALRPGLFEKRVGSMSGPPGPPVAVIATSATLATGDGDFDYLAEEIGCPAGYESLIAPSPFDWPRQCLFICPAGMPEPNAPEFKDAVANTVRRVIELARGRTLGLFTSRRVLDHTFGEVSRRCRELGIVLLKQGDAPRTQLLDTFKKDISSVLLGTESFWAGVDVPGESLSVVVIDRLPFPTPDDPVLDVLASSDDNWFRKYSIPRAMIAFKQGFGRLIRSVECHGVVVCLDNRLMEKRYGKQFLRSLPKGVTKTTNLDAIAGWLGLAIPVANTPPTLSTAPSAPTIPEAAAPPTPATTPSPAAPAAHVEPVPQLSLFARPLRPLIVVLPPGWDDVDPLPPAVAAWDEL